MAVKVFKAWLSNYNPLFYWDVIHLPNADAGLTDLCY